jgi:DNA polymerase-3 subunit gamma/tau
MDYLVLARKLRPQRFQDLVGQETVARALRNALVTGRVAHAFLFAGSRGVGKTSTARILTKALNCRQPQQGEPCNQCPICLEINAGASPDVFEIDAASNRGIDNIRELRENVKYAPAKCAYKTYIIDEVHMLTAESFNALLKTLEEPPPHVKFILATTHPHRIPDTILSRCQRYDFPRIPLGRMVDYLTEVTRKEGLAFSRSALETIARNAAGGMRDALTAIDQAVSFAGSAPSDAEVVGLLGLMDNGEVLNLLAAILDRSLEQALETFGLIVSRGHDPHVLLESLLREVKDLALFQTLGKNSAYFQDHLQDSLQFYEARQGTMGLDELQQLFQLFLELESQLKSSAFGKACFEMALVQACRVQPLVGVPELLARARELLRGAPGGDSRPAPPPRATTQDVRRPPPPPTAEPPAVPPSAAAQAAAARTPGAQARPRAAAREARSEGGDADAEPQPGDALSIPPGGLPESLCEDPRWVMTVQELSGSPRLAAKLRGSQVLAISSQSVEVLIQSPPLAGEELEQVQAALQKTFGPAFLLVPAHDTLRQPAGEHTLAGRKRIREAIERKAKQEAALADPAVQTLRRLFPNSTVVRVELDAARPERSDDVQG